MLADQNNNLVRKQLMLSNTNIKKIDRISKERKVSAANVVRLAIDSFNPDNILDDMDSSELAALVSTRLKETITDTINTRERLNKTLTLLEEREL